MSSGNIAPIRRNGKPHSCEPCRRSKVRCDHKLPICDRCISRRIERDCVYHPAPMTKVSTSHNRIIPSPQSQRESPSDSIQRPLPAFAPLNATRPPIKSTAPSSVRRTDTADEAEFLGPTSFSAIINDDRDIVDRHTAQFPSQESRQESGLPHKHVSEERINAGMGILSLLVEVPSLAENIQRYLDLTYTCMIPDPFVKACVGAVQHTFRGFFHQHRPRKDYWRPHIVTLFENMSKALRLFTSTKAHEYHTLFTGPNLRWETVGFVLAMLGVSLKYDVNRRSKTTSDGMSMEESNFIFRIVDAVEYCTSICHSFNSVNHQALWLLYGEACLKSLVYGDTSFRVWRSIGELTSMFFALGLHHTNVKYEDGIPIYQYELRKRYAAQIFSMDKTISTMLGRPPRIAGGYCADIMPSDMDDSALLLENAELTATLNNVNEDGWNRDGRFRGSTWRRVKLIISRFREEVLGLCLGVPIGDIELQARDILARHEKMWDQIPPDLKYNEATGSEHVAAPQRYVMMTTYMDQNYNRFLLHQKLVKNGRWSKEPLYRISRSQLATVLQVISLSDRVSDMKRDGSWFMLYYGLPGASILAVDLLKQTIQAQNATLNNNNHAKEQQQQQMIKNAIPRAEVIQNLAVFVSSLQRTTSYCAKANTDSCKWAHRVLSYILGEILDPKPYDALATAAGEGQNASDRLMVNMPPLPSPAHSAQDLDGGGGGGGIGMAAAAAAPDACATLDLNDFFNWVAEADWARDTSALL